MKNRKLLYILMPAVVIIWGIIIYKVLSWMDEGNQEQGTPTTIIKKSLSPDAKDTFSLLLNYPDPFGFHPAISHGTTQPLKKAASLKTWPSISFYGSVSIGKKKTILASLRVNGNDIIMKPGDTCTGMRLVKVKKEVIVVSYHGEEREISRDNEKR